MERPTGVVVQGPMTSRPALLAVCALSLAWISIATVYLYPDLKEEVDEKRYLHRAGKLHIPVLPLECGRARGVEIETSFERTGTRKGAGRRSRSSIRSIRRSLRPLTSVQRCGPICLSASRWRTGTPLEALLRAAGISLGTPAVIALALVTWT